MKAHTWLAKTLIRRTGAAAAVLTLMATGAVAQVRMTYAHSENPSATTAAESFKRIVEGRSGGEIKVNLVIHGALGGDRDVADQLSLGELEMYVPGVHGLSAIAPNFQYFDAPYLFTNRREFYTLMQDGEFVDYVNDYLRPARGRAAFRHVTDAPPRPIPNRAPAPASRSAAGR